MDESQGIMFCAGVIDLVDVKRQSDQPIAVVLPRQTRPGLGKTRRVRASSSARL